MLYVYFILYVENTILIEAEKPETAPRVVLINCGVQQGCPSVSYTHLDVYKRQD